MAAESVFGTFAPDEMQTVRPKSRRSAQIDPDNDSSDIRPYAHPVRWTSWAADIPDGSWICNDLDLSLEVCTA